MIFVISFLIISFLFARKYIIYVNINISIILNNNSYRMFLMRCTKLQEEIEGESHTTDHLQLYFVEVWHNSF